MEKAYWKIYDSDPDTVRITVLPNACSCDIQTLREKREKEISDMLYKFSPAVAELMGIDIVSFSELDRNVKMQGLLSWYYYEVKSDDENLAKFCSYLGLNNWRLPETERNSRSLKRTKKNFVELALNNDFDKFGTLTMNSANGDRYSLSEAKAQFKKAIKGINKKYGCRIRYIVIPERHKDGAWHFHGLFGGIPDEALELFKYRTAPVKIRKRMKDGIQVFRSPDFQKYLGFNDFEPIQNQEAVTRYCTKYITKDIMEAEVAKGTQLLLCSQGLTRPIHGSVPDFLDSKALQYELLRFYKPTFTGHYKNKTAPILEPKLPLVARKYDEHYKIRLSYPEAEKEKEPVATPDSVSYFCYSIPRGDFEDFLRLHGKSLMDCLSSDSAKKLVECQELIERNVINNGRQLQSERL